MGAKSGNLIEWVFGSASRFTFDATAVFLGGE